MEEDSPQPKKEEEILIKEEVIKERKEKSVEP